ncbi:hypothetical protein K1719_037167 [Acacia pycnantha]|nr:hypothetical protein K1719_037167 [Acacia pycnantha]
MGVPLADKFWAGSSSLDPDEASFNMEEDEASFNENMGIEPFLLTAVYVVPYESLKFSLWQDLQRLADHISIPWVVMGDFNDILMSDERVGGADINLGRLRKFQDRVQGCQLNDLGFSGPKFTWRGPRTTNCSRLYERLDRALANVHFLAATFDCFI